MLSSVNKETGELSQVAGRQATADKIFYDNSETGIPASNVQDAIDKSTRIFYGTRDEWNALSLSEKVTYEYAAFTEYDTLGETFARVWKGTKSDWNNLPVETKKLYGYAVFTDDYVPPAPSPSTDRYKSTVAMTEYVDQNNVSCFVRGKVAMLGGYFTTKGAISSTLADILTNLPLPAYNQDLEILGSDLNSTDTYRLLIRGSGRTVGGLQVRNGTIPTNRYIGITATYICE
jgi:hypothetical protein